MRSFLASCVPLNIQHCLRQHRDGIPLKKTQNSEVSLYIPVVCSLPLHYTIHLPSGPSDMVPYNDENVIWQHSFGLSFLRPSLTIAHFFLYSQILSLYTLHSILHNDGHYCWRCDIICFSITACGFYYLKEENKLKKKSVATMTATNSIPHQYWMPKQLSAWTWWRRHFLCSCKLRRCLMKHMRVERIRRRLWCVFGGLLVGLHSVILCTPSDVQVLTVLRWEYDKHTMYTFAVHWVQLLGLLASSPRSYELCWGITGKSREISLETWKHVVQLSIW